MPALPTIVAGDTYAVTINLRKDDATYPPSDLVDAVGTVTFVERAHPGTKRIEDKTVVINSDNSTALISLTVAESILLRTHPDPTRSVMHIADVKIDEFSSPVQHTESFLVPVRRAIT